MIAVGWNNDMAMFPESSCWMRQEASKLSRLCLRIRSTRVLSTVLNLKMHLFLGLFPSLHFFTNTTEGTDSVQHLFYYVVH